MTSATLTTTTILPPSLPANSAIAYAYLARPSSYHLLTVFSPCSLTMQRPGPLCDLPLERFISEANAAHIGSSPFKQPRSSKRPLSPGATSPSGSKRRLLDTQVDASPRRSGRSSTAPCQPQQRGLRGSVQKPIFRAVRAQAFMPSYTPPDSTPLHTSTRTDKSRCTSAPPSPSSPQSSHDRHGGIPTSTTPMECDDGQAPYSTSSGTNTLWSLNEYPLSYGVHDPGFDIYHDPVESLGPLYGRLSLDNGLSPLVLEDMNKENVAPSNPESMVLSKPDLPHSWSIAGLLSPEQMCSENDLNYTPMSMTPLAQKFGSTSMAHISITPRPKKVPLANRASSPLLASPASARESLDKPGRLERRRLLADEADGMDWLDDGGL